MSVFHLGEGRLEADTLVALSRQEKPDVEVGASSEARVKKYRKMIEEYAFSDKSYYGINTGFGYLSSVRIPPEKLVVLQENIIRSHACGVGDPLSLEVARAVLLLRAHTFMLGHTGISWSVVETILSFIDKGIMPFLPEKGSVGASGDLAPLAHLALNLMGEGDVFVDGCQVDAATALKNAGIKPIAPKAKEGLSLINGTHIMAAIGAFAIQEAESLARAADVACALSLDVFRGSTRAFDRRIHNLRRQAGQSKVAENMRVLFEGPDEIQDSHEDCDRVQDPYSFRCAAQVHGASRDAIQYGRQVIDNELNSVTDNPLVFDDGSIISGGNFHGQPIAMAMDFLGIAVCELGSISEQRVAKLTNPTMSEMPTFLVKDPGLNSGFMIPHVVQAALVSENKILAHPACVDSIPTNVDKEDHVSMGPIAARKARMINANVAKVIAIELLAAAQGIDLLKPLKTASNLTKVYEKIRELSPVMDGDRSLHRDIEAVADWLLTGELDKFIEKECINIV